MKKIPLFPKWTETCKKSTFPTQFFIQDTHLQLQILTPNSFIAAIHKNFKTTDPKVENEM